MIAWRPWPTHDLLSRWTTIRKARRRILIEDALKHLYDCQYHERGATLQSLSGALEISGNRASEILRSLGATGLVRSTGSGPTLTNDGCRYALQLIRMHRLWEQYVAEHTGVAATQWHIEADRREHLMSPGEVEALVTKLGNPKYDPHGDVIPSATGEIAPRIG